MTRLLSLFAFFQALVLSFAQDCYWPNGDRASTDWKPCNNKAGTCCFGSDDAHTDLCYDNGFCFSVLLGDLYRGACTSKTYGSTSGCASNCISVNRGGQSLISPCADRTLCCGGAENVTSCCSSKSGFDWSNATLLARSSSSRTTSSTASNASSSNDTSRPAAGNSDIALKIGLGTALGLSLAIISALVVVIMGQRRRLDHQQTFMQPGSSDVTQHVRAKAAGTPWALQHEASSFTVASEPPRSPIMLSDSRIHELNAHT